jgi:hypothetical protein
MDPETSWTISERVTGASHDDYVNEENVFENDPETESELRKVVSKIFLTTALTTMRRSFWEDYNSRIELLLVMFRFMRLSRQKEDDVRKMVEFIVETNFGGAEEMAELKDMGYSFQDKYVLEIAYALGNKTPDGFIDTVIKFYSLDVITLVTKNSIKTLRVYIEQIANNVIVKIEEMKVLIMDMILTNGNPSFSRFGLVLRNLYDISTSEGEKTLDLSTIKQHLKRLAKDNKGVFLDCEDSIFEMFKEMNREINANCVIDEIGFKEIKGIIHKNTPLNPKNGKVVNKYEKDGDNTTRKNKNKRSIIDENDSNILRSSNNVDNEIPKPNKRKKYDDDDDDDDVDDDSASNDADFHPSDEEGEEEDESDEEQSNEEQSDEE